MTERIVLQRGTRVVVVGSSVVGPQGPAGGGGGGGVTDGNKGDITVSGAGTVWSFSADMATQAELDAHVSDSSDAHDASAISVLDSGALLAATDVEGALAEIATDIDNHVSDSSAAHAASAISYAGGTGMSATDVEAAIDELATEKQNALRTIGTQSGATYTLAAGDAGTLLLLTDSSPDLTVPDDGDVTWAVGASVDVIGTAGPVTLIEDTLVTVNVAAGQSLVTEDAGSAFTLVKTAAQTWWAFGRFAVAP